MQETAHYGKGRNTEQRHFPVSSFELYLLLYERACLQTDLKTALLVKASADVSVVLGSSLNSQLRLPINLTCCLQVIHGPLRKKHADF